MFLAHEHRDRRRAFGKALKRWDAADNALSAFTNAAAACHLRVKQVSSERPLQGEVKGRFRRWTADISILEVVVDENMLENAGGEESSTCGEKVQ